MKIHAFLSLILVLCLPPGIFAVGVAGRFTTAAYTYEREIPDSLNTGAIRFFQTGSLTLTGLGSPRASLQTSLRTSLDLIHRAENDPSTRVYSAFWRWAGESVTFTGGRQFISAGVGVGTVDGMRIAVRFKDYLRLDFYGGTLAPLGRSRVFNAWDDGHMAGIHLVSKKMAGTTLGASFFRRTRRVEPYWSRLGAGYPDSVWVDRVVLNGSYEVRPNALDQEMAGLDIEKTVGPSSLYGWLDLGLAGPVRVRRGEVEYRFSAVRSTAFISYLFRSPWASANSIFSIFTQRPSHEVTGRGEVRISLAWGLSGDVSALSFAGRAGFRAGGGITLANGYLGYTLRRGYGGTSDGIGLEIRPRLGGKVWMDVGGHVESFRYEEGPGARSRVLSGTLGVNFRPTKHLSLSVEGQGLSQNLRTPTRLNPFPGLRHDFRFYFRASTWFFHDESSKGAPE